MKIKLIFDKTTNKVVSENGSTIFNTVDDQNHDNDCPNDVVDVVIEMYNDGKSLMEIDEYLLDACCTQDAREIIIESLYHLYPENN